jgi:hypothetical protein
MRRGIIFFIAVFLLLLLAPAGIRYLRYYDLGGGNRAQPPAFDPGDITEVPTPAATDYMDDPEPQEGFVLLDQAHENAFTLDEIGYLDGRLAARGFELLHYTGGDLNAALRPANAFVVITPLTDFTLGERQAVSNFVDRGGRLLMVGDPTRFNVIVEEDEFTFSFHLEGDKIPLNSLANEFDIIFNGDYLYNTIENEGNFRNIVLKEGGFAEDALTEGLERLAFYGAHSLEVGSDGVALLTADDNTWSSGTDRPGELALAVSSNGGRALALGDINFLSQPYYTVFDNSQFIARIADFLTEPSTRGFILADFPYFYRNPINLVYTGAPDLGPDAFDEIIALQDAFRDVDQTLSLVAVPQSDRDTLYLGLYNQSDEVAEILSSAGITLTIAPPIGEEKEDEVEAAEESEAESDEVTPEAEETAVRLVESELGKVQMSGTALILLDESQGRRNVIVLAASNDGLENTIDRLLNLVPLNADYALADCLLQNTLALCPTDVVDEEVEAQLETSGVPEEEGEEEEEEEEEEGEETGGDIDAVDQGSIGLDETVEGTLAEGEAHAWTFSDGPATIDIVVESGEELDAILELYNPDNQLIESSDSGFTGENEEILGVDIPDEEEYTILIRDFFEDGGSYTLTVSMGEPGEESASEGIFIFADDDGAPLTTGFTSVETLVALLADEHEVTTWVSSEDGPLEADAPQGYELIIWDSGDYRNEDGFFDEDGAVILNALEEGGNLLVTGSSPTLFGDTELAALADVEVAGADPVLLDGLTVGEIFELDQTYDAVLSDVLSSDTEENSVAFFLRGPASEESGNVTGIAIEEEFNEQRTIFLLVPFIALPDDVQELLLDNFINWFGVGQ